MPCRYSTRSSSCKFALRSHGYNDANGCRLLFMTYNGWIMLAVAVGAFVGYLMFSQSSSTKTVACH